ncbi:MAG: ParB/RepB/Spo0J family partition protein [Oscillospiraceae bacterium]|nr:ParB/RepB/Spo0J family partition protein [Oscillospiraceae bacterium]
MANPAKGLGKGLGALLGNDFMDTQEEKERLELPISQIENSSSQPRKTFDPEALEDLAESIRQHGILQPLTVRRLQSGYYQIIAGERRWRAAKLAGLSRVPAIVIEADDQKAMELAMIENLQREDLNPLEEARGYQALTDRFGLTQEQAAQRVGKSRAAVTNALRLLHLQPTVQAMVEENRLSAGHARALLMLSGAVQEDAARAVERDHLSVRQTELLVKRLSAGKKPARPTTGITVNYAEAAAQELSSRLGRGCRIVGGKKKGKIELEYYGTDDLNGLIDALYTMRKN